MLKPQLPAGWSLPDLGKVQYFKLREGAFSCFKEVSKDVYHLFSPPLHLSFLSPYLQRLALGSLSLVLKGSSVFCADNPGLGGRVCLFLRTVRFVVTLLAHL